MKFSLFESNQHYDLNKNLKISAYNLHILRTILKF